MELAHSLGYKAVKTEATGLYSRSVNDAMNCFNNYVKLCSRKAFERLGFRVASEFLYTEYKVKRLPALLSIKQSVLDNQQTN